MLALTAVHRRVLHRAAADDGGRAAGGARSAGRADEVVRHRSERPDVRADGEGLADGCRTRPAISVLFISPIFAVIVAGILFAIFNAAHGRRGVVQTGLRGAGRTPARCRRCRRCFRASSITSAAAWRAPRTSARCCRCCPRVRSSANLLGTVDVFLIWYIVVLAMGLAVLYRRRTQPIAISLLVVYAVIAVVIAVVKSRAGGA